jgi:HAE1 family hydrophobic/amphiphilic exporter-1
MLILAPVVLGLASYTRLGVELFPNVDVPVVVVTTTLKGAGVDEMESAVTKPVEDAVNTISGIDELRSTTREGFSQIVVGFKLEKNGDIAAQEIRDKMTLVQSQLPPGTEAPKVEKFNLDAAPVITIAVSGRRSLREVTEIAKTLIRDDLQGAADEGVGAVVLVGGEQRAVTVTVDPDKLKSRKLSIAQVSAGLQNQNIELPGGRVDQNRSEQQLRTVGRVPEVDDFNRIVIANLAGHPVRLDEIGKATNGIEEPRTLSRLDGDVAVSLVVQKRSGANTVKVADAIVARLEVIKKNLPPDIRVEVIRNQSRFIKGSIEEVKFHLLLAAVLVSTVLLLFIRDWRTTLIAALAVPTSIVGTFALMDFMGFSLNNMTLLGLILAVGIVIDDAVVVLENVFRHMEEYGRTPWDAARIATSEIALAVLATTMSLAVVFAPIAFMSGQVGRFFNSFGFVVGFAIILSMVVSFTLTPMLCARFLKPLKHSHGDTQRGFWGWVTRMYVAVLAWCLGGRSGWRKLGPIPVVWLPRGWRRLTVVGAAAACFMSTPILFMLVGTDFVPKDDQSEFEVALTLPEGTSLAAGERLCSELEGRLKQIRGVTNVFTTIGETSGRQAKGQGDVTKVTIYCKMSDLTERDFAQKDAMVDARRMLADYPDLRITVQEVKLFSSSAFKNVQVEVSLRGPDGDKLDAYADRIVKWLRANPNFTDVDTDAASRTPEMQVQIDRSRAGDLKLNVQAIATTLGVLVGGEPISKYKEGAEQYDVWLRAEPRTRNRRDVIEELTVPTTTGELVELRNFATVEYARGPATISRYNRQRNVSITCNLASGVALGKVLPDIAQYIKTLDLPPEYRTEFLGEAKLMADSNSNFALAFLLAFVFMYMILAAQFESLVHPITILLAVPLTLPFALVSLLILQTALDVYAMIGLFMLFGIVKKNGILQVDYTNVLRAKGLGRDEAILKANEARLRPILMTTIMLVAAMIPIATGKGPGASARASMAKVILGGQFLSLFLSLLITPIAYSIWDDLTEWIRGWWQPKPKPPVPTAVPREIEPSAQETIEESYSEGIPSLARETPEVVVG